MKLRKIGSLCLSLLLLLCLGGCGKSAKIEDVEELTRVVTEGELQELKAYPNLKKLDISGSTCYPAIMKFVSDCPQIDVTYTVTLGSTVISNKSAQAELMPEDCSLEELKTHLRYLPNLTALSLPNTNLTLAQITQLRESYPRITLDYTVTLLGTEYPMDAQSADLSALTAEQIGEAGETLSLLPELTNAELMDSSGKSPLTPAQVKQLMDAAPQVDFHYSFDLFGQTVSTDDTRIEYVGADIGNQGEAELRQALEILTNCEYFLLDSCGLDNEVLAAIREDFPDTKVVWRVQFGKYSTLTDAEMIKAVYNVFDNTSQDLRYCNEVKYIDMGHNQELTDISFMGYMPNLEIVIISGSAVRDISCFAGCPNLEFLEMAYCSFVEDLSPLENCTKLRFLNVSFTSVEDLMPLDNLPLERFVCLDPNVSAQEQQFFQDFHPDCWTRFSGQDPYSLGWRYDDVGETFSEFYKKMRDIFQYE